MDLGFERNRRREFEAADATDVALGLLRARIAGTYGSSRPLGVLGGIVGASWSRNSSRSSAEETLIPDNNYSDLGAYAFEQAELGRWNVSAGARYDYRRLNVDDDAELGVVAQRAHLQLGYR